MKHGAVLIDNSRCAGLDEVWRPERFYERLRGLLGKQRLAANQGMWFERCNSIHMFGMRFAIDVVFMDKQGKVLKIAQRVKPFTMASCLAADSTLEIAAGRAEQLNIQPASVLSYEQDAI